MSDAYKEALRECCIRYAEARDQVEEMEQLIAQAYVVSLRGETPGKLWQRHAESLLRRLREDEQDAIKETCH